MFSLNPRIPLVSFVSKTCWLLRYIQLNFKYPYSITASWELRDSLHAYAVLFAYTWCNIVTCPLKEIVFAQPRGQTDSNCSAPCSIIMTLRKLKTTMPSLKPPVNKMIRSGDVYQISCPCCTACYVGQTSRHLQTCIREHTKNQGPVKTHLHQCNTTITEEHIYILSSTSRGESHLLTLEALYIQELDPKINTKDEYRSRTLTIRI